MQTAAEITRLNQLDRNGWLAGHITTLQGFISGWQLSISKNNDRLAPTNARLERAIDRRGSVEKAVPANQNHIKDAVTEVTNCTSLLGELDDLNTGYANRIDIANRNIENFQAQIVN